MGINAIDVGSALGGGVLGWNVPGLIYDNPTIMQKMSVSGLTALAALAISRYTQQSILKNKKGGAGNAASLSQGFGNGFAESLTFVPQSAGKDPDSTANIGYKLGRGLNPVSGAGAVGLAGGYLGSQAYQAGANKIHPRLSKWLADNAAKPKGQGVAWLKGWKGLSPRSRQPFGLVKAKHGAAALTGAAAINLLASLFSSTPYSKTSQG